MRHTVDAVLDAVLSNDPPSPFPALGPAELRSATEHVDPLPDIGCEPERVLSEIGRVVLRHGVRVTDPYCAAHLHSPTLITAAVTELAIGLTNQSMDSFDQAPVATYVEDLLVRTLAAVLGLPGTASGVLTSGGTSSNLLGLLLARERAGTGTTVSGLPGESRRWRVLTSAAAHISVRQAASVLGLGRDAVVPVGTDHAGRMRVDDLDRVLAGLDDAGLSPIALVGTAGTTDSGAIDPLDALADRAAARGAWFHIDAAVGSALALSERLRPMLAGLERADSITADLHKLWWQPIGASALLVRNAGTLHGFREPADYLNRRDGTAELDLVDRSLDTSRRFDALKILVSLRITGRLRLAGFVEHLVDLTAEAGRLVDAHPQLELIAPPQTVTVLFRCRAPEGSPVDGQDALNTRVQRDLLASGRAVVGRTRWKGRTVLKLTLVNPLATAGDIAGLLDLIAGAAGPGIQEGMPYP
nr:pyridoxal-dependent decarboxylase [Phytoactinopolyspora alkaliphila]